MQINNIYFFYINCKVDKNKDNLIIKQWKETCNHCEKKINIERKDAVHFLDYSYPYYTECHHVNSIINDNIANIAVFKSHTNLWKYIWDKNIKYAFIFEDDVIIPKTFLNDLETILNNENIPSKWDILYFGILRMLAKKSTNSNFHKMLNSKGFNNGLHAYLINRESAGKLINLITRYGPCNQIDIFLRDHADLYNFYIYHQLIIKQNVDELESTRLGRFVKDEYKKTFDEITLLP